MQLYADHESKLAFHNGALFVSGTSNEEWSGKIRLIPYPFDDEADSTAIRIFHTAHGRWETGAPARVFAPYRDTDGEVDSRLPIGGPDTVRDNG